MPNKEKTENKPKLDEIIIKRETRSILYMYNNIIRERYVMNLDCDPKMIWSDEKQSKFIESCIKGVPLSPIYTAEGEDGRLIIVKGLQRFNAIRRFINRQLTLKGIGDDDLDRKSYRDLSIQLQDIFENREAVVYILDNKMSESFKFKTLELVDINHPMSRQQIRHALYGGKGTKLLVELSKDSNFNHIIKHSRRGEDMKYREIINRFLAFKLLGLEGYRKYQGDMDSFLSAGIREANKLSNEDIKNIADDFKLAMKFNLDTFNRRAFRSSLVDYRKGFLRDRQVPPLEESIFDVMSFPLVDDSDILNVFNDNKIHFIKAVSKVFKNENFLESISTSTDDVRNVERRFNIFNEAMDKLKRKIGCDKERDTDTEINM